MPLDMDMIEDAGPLTDFYVFSRAGLSLINIGDKRGFRLNYHTCIICIKWGLVMSLHNICISQC